MLAKTREINIADVLPGGTLKTKSVPSSRTNLAVLSLCLMLPVAACQKQEAVERQPLLVRAEKVRMSEYAPTTTLTGVIAAQTLNNMSFQVGGRVAERNVDVGQRVERNEVLARLDPQEQQSDVKAAQASLDAAQAQLRQASAALDRQKTLLAQGFTTRRDYDLAEQSLKVAQGGVESAKSQLATAKDRLSYTELRAGAAGVLTARMIEVGQVVQAAQTVFTIAEDGDRDAVFNVGETLVARNAVAPAVKISLLSNPTVEAAGVVREVSPAVDPASGTIRVKVAIPNTPADMQLGAAISGTVMAQGEPAVVLPWLSLTSRDGRPTVWTVDPKTNAVAPQTIEILAFGSDVVVISSGLEPGQTVVTAGGQLLTSGQIVEVAP